MSTPGSETRTGVNMLEYYSRRAAEYEKIYHKPERQADLGALRSLVSSYFRDADVLELACGTGYWSEIIAPAARSLVATDFSGEVLEIARNKRYGHARVRFEIADAFSPGSVRGNFNAGFAGFWWSHLRRDEIMPFLRAFHARLGPGARVLFLDNRYVEGSSTPISRTDAGGNTYQLRQLADGSRYEVVKNFPASAELQSMVATVAADVRVTELGHYWCLAYRVAPATSSGSSRSSRRA